MQPSNSPSLKGSKGSLAKTKIQILIAQTPSVDDLEYASVAKMLTELEK